MKISKEEREEVRKFVREFGNPVITEITLLQRLFYPTVFFHMREIIYYYIKSGKVKVEVTA